MKKLISIVLLILLCVWSLYDQTSGFDFLRLDDHDYTFRCLFVRDGLSAENVAESFTNLRHAGVWMPATYISYMADISLFGNGMGPHHTVNVALHSLNAVLLFFLLLALSRCVAPPAEGTRPSLLVPTLAALFWALHPQRVEAVAWIAGRKDVLCCTFTLAGLLCWLRPTWGGRLGAALCGVLACLSKPTGMCYPVLLFAVDLLRGRLRGLGRGDFAVYGSTLLMGVLTGGIAMYSQTHPEGHLVRELFTTSFPWRVLNALVATGLDLSQLVVPLGLHLDYRAVPGQFPLQGVQGLVALFVAASAAGFAAWRFPRVRRPLAALLLFFFATLVPTLGIFGSFGEHARADRFLYLPMLAVSLAAIWWRPSRTRLVGWLGGVLVLALAVVSWPLVSSYRNDFTAFSRTLALDPDHGRALAHVASEECARNHIDQGIDLYRRSQQLRPRDDTASQLAYALMLRARTEDHAEIRQLCSKFACDHSLDRKGQALEALGMIAMRQRRWAEAISCLEDSIKAPARFYTSDDAFFNLACCYTNVKRADDAIAVFERLAQSRRKDIAGRANEALVKLKANPRARLSPQD